MCLCILFKTVKHGQLERTLQLAPLHLSWTRFSFELFNLSVFPLFFIARRCYSDVYMASVLVCQVGFQLTIIKFMLISYANSIFPHSYMYVRCTHTVYTAMCLSVSKRLLTQTQCYVDRYERATWP